MRQLIRACIAMAATVATLVVPAMASASPELTDPTGTLAPTGLKLMATNVAHSNTTSVIKFTSSITVECQTATLTGELTSNSKTHIAGSITTAEFKNHTAGTCSSSLGATQITPSHTSVPSHGGQSSLPWCLTANSLNDKFEVTGGACGSPRALFFTLDYPGFSCTYSKASLTATYTTHPADAVVTVDPAQIYPKVTGGIFCPNEGSLDMAFTLTTDINGVSGTPLYIR